MIKPSELELEAEKFIKDDKYKSPEYQNLIFGYSIAISLKRIADKLELASKQPIIMTAEEALEYYKKKDGC